MENWLSKAKKIEKCSKSYLLSSVLLVATSATRLSRGAETIATTTTITAVIASIPGTATAVSRATLASASGSWWSLGPLHRHSASASGERKMGQRILLNRSLTCLSNWTLGCFLYAHRDHHNHLCLCFHDDPSLELARHSLCLCVPPKRYLRYWIQTHPGFNMQQM